MRRKILAIGIALILVVVAIGTAFYLGTTAKAGVTDDITAASLQNMTWGDIVAAARGETVNWYMYGGDPNTDSFVENQISQEAANYGITINPVYPSGAIQEIVADVQQEKAAGENTNGPIDLIWLNGANFQTLRSEGLLFGPWANELPNTMLVNWSESFDSERHGLPGQRIRVAMGDSAVPNDLQLRTIQRVGTAQEPSTAPELGRGPPRKFHLYCSTRLLWLDVHERDDVPTDRRIPAVRVPEH